MHINFLRRYKKSKELVAIIREGNLGALYPPWLINTVKLLNLLVLLDNKILLLFIIVDPCASTTGQ